MKYSEKYPKLPIQFKPPHPELAVEPDLEQTTMVYQCVICNILTGFILHPSTYPIPCCSEECRKESESFIPEVDFIDEIVSDRLVDNPTFATMVLEAEVKRDRDTELEGINDKET